MNPVAFLTETLASAERERDILAERVARLEALQRTFVEISAASDERGAIRSALRGAWLALGFERALWFEADGDDVRATMVSDAGNVIEASNAVGASNAATGAEIDDLYADAFPDQSALVRIAACESDAATGYAGDADAALHDVRGWYAVAAARTGASARGILYADGSRERSLSAWSSASVAELAMHVGLVIENRRLATELERLAMRDVLTGLFNRRALFERFEIELAAARRTQTTLAFALLDVDDFKRINDTQGHAGGDAALVRLADAMRATTRETDVPARFAGDEFAILLPRSDEASVRMVLDRVYAALRERGLSCSCGAAFSGADGDDAQALLEAADRRVYIAKDAGKNRYVVT